MAAALTPLWPRAQQTLGNHSAALMIDQMFIVVPPIQRQLHGDHPRPLQRQLHGDRQSEPNRPIRRLAAPLRQPGPRLLWMSVNTRSERPQSATNELWRRTNVLARQVHHGAHRRTGFFSAPKRPYCTKILCPSGRLIQAPSSDARLSRQANSRHLSESLHGRRIIADDLPTIHGSVGINDICSCATKSSIIQ